MKSIPIHDIPEHTTKVFAKLMLIFSIFTITKLHGSPINRLYIQGIFTFLTDPQYLILKSYVGRLLGNLKEVRGY